MTDNNNTKIEVFRGDITTTQVDAIVNAANSSLMGGGGVDGAIHAAGGPSVLQECKVIREKQGECPTGEAVITGAGNMPSKHVIHTVGPVWHGGQQNEPQLLANCYRNALQLAMDYGCKAVAFPNISTGIFGYPKDAAATVAIGAVLDFISQHPTAFEKVVFVCFDDENYGLYEAGLREVLG